VRTAQAEEAASAAREYSAALKDELEKLKASTSDATETWALERDALIAKHETKVLAVDAHHEKRVEALKEEHRATLAAVDGRVRNTIGRMRDDNIRLKSQLAASQEREGALSRVLSDQAARLLSEA
jgi:demethoxyubiquinone hydroxylase (CLK1/Coq7/Cat5 family)